LVPSLYGGYADLLCIQVACIGGIVLLGLLVAHNNGTTTLPPYRRRMTAQHFRRGGARNRI
jgi:hypothetical protein